MFPLPSNKTVHGQAFRTTPECWRHGSPRFAVPGRGAYRATSAAIRGLFEASCPLGCSGSKPPSFLSLGGGEISPVKTEFGLKDSEKNEFGSSGPSGIGWGGNRGDPTMKEERGELCPRLAVSNGGEWKES